MRLRNSFSLVPVAALVVLASLVGAPSLAQEGFDQMSAGRHFVLTFPDTAQNKRDPRYSAPKYEQKWLAFVYSPVDNRLRVTSPGVNRAPVNIAGGRVTVVDFRSTDFSIPQTMTVEPICRAARTTIRLEADEPVIVYCFVSTSFGGEAFTPLPVESWGTEYYAAGYSGEQVRDLTIVGNRGVLTKRSAPAEIVVVAAYDGTRVIVAPNGPTARACPGTDFTLNAGESVVVESFVDTLLDENQASFAGSYIFATRPVGVLSGNTRAQMLSEVTSMTGNTLRNLQIEWLSPVEFHGTTFVYMPTWDSRRPTGVPGENLTEKRSVELVRAYGTSADSTAGSVSNGTQNPTPYETAVRRGGTYQTRQIPTVATVHTLSSPGQVMMSSVPISVLRRTQSNPWGWSGGEYDTWSGYMVELVPRERWTTFAPAYATAAPAGLEHYVNVVTDTNHAQDVYLADGRRFAFNRGIAGTDLIWGTMALQAGQSTWLSGRNGARFGGFVYGLYTTGGHEEIRLGIRPEYEEWIGIAYGYPLASSHVVVGVRDTVVNEQIDRGCGAIEIRLSTVNEGAAGYYAIELRDVRNARIARISPDVVTGALAASVTIEPIDPLADANATLVVTSRTGEIVEIPYVYVAYRAALGDGGTTSFGTMTRQQSSSRQIPLMNLGPVPVTVESIAIGPSAAFSATPESPLPRMLAPGESMVISVSTDVAELSGTIIDTLTANLTCGTLSHPVSVRIIAPSISVSDLDFGDVDVGAKAVRRMLLRNTSMDTLALNASPDAVIVSDNPLFAISVATREMIAGLSVQPGASVEIPVEFLGAPAGSYGAIAHVRSNAVSGVATSTWTARVAGVTSVGNTDERSDISFTVLPQPVRSTLRVSCLINGFPVLLELLDLHGCRRAVSTSNSGEFAVDVSELPAGFYVVRLSSSARRSERPVLITR